MRRSKHSWELNRRIRRKHNIIWQLLEILAELWTLMVTIYLITTVSIRIAAVPVFVVIVLCFRVEIWDWLCRLVALVP